MVAFTLFKLKISCRSKRNKCLNLKERKVSQRQQSACMNENGYLDKTQTQKGKDIRCWNRKRWLRRAIETLYRSTIDKVRKAHLELKLKDMNLNKEIFYRYFRSKQRMRKNVSLLPNRTWDLSPKDMDNAKALNALFALVFIGKICLPESQSPEANSEVWSKRSYWRTLKQNWTYGSHIPKWCGSWMSLFSITFERSWWSGIWGDGQKANATPAFKKDNENPVN